MSAAVDSRIEALVLARLLRRGLVVGYGEGERRTVAKYLRPSGAIPGGVSFATRDREPSILIDTREAAKVVLCDLGSGGGK